jgi:uncharacterized protein (DUF58 family)
MTAAADLGYRFVTARTVAMLKDLELAARRIVEGSMLGRHRSRRAGAGLEFSQYRSYQPGDDLRRVDWKLYARSDRHFVREAESETSVVVRLVLDATGSMAHEENGISKFDYARYLAAAFALLAHRQGDALGLTMLRAGRVEGVRPRRDAPQLHRVLHALEQATPAGRWPTWDRIERAMALDPLPGLTILLGDLREQNREIEAAARHLAGLRHELSLFEITGRAEAEFDYRGVVGLEDLETFERLDLDAAAVRDAAVAALAAERRALRTRLEHRGATVVACLLDEPFEGPLRAYLARRERLAP